MPWTAAAIVGSAVLGAWSSGQNANKQRDANQQALDTENASRKTAFDMGEPFRAQLADLTKDPNAFFNRNDVKGAIDAGTNATARNLSIQGNPMDSGNALTGIRDYAVGKQFDMLNNEKARLANLGGLSGFNSQASTFPTPLPFVPDNRYNQIQGGLGQLAGYYQRQQDKDWYSSLNKGSDGTSQQQMLNKQWSE